MSNSQTYLWNRILLVNQEMNGTNDALIKWEKSMLLKVLIHELKEDMGEAAYFNLLQSSKHLLSSAKSKSEKSH